MNETRLILLHALTPLHVGTGQAVGNVDLPIAREKATGFPIVPASALKGVLRDQFGDQSWAAQAFGDADRAGAWMFTDLRILCLPVRSFFGVFAYATCPLILERLRRHAEAFGITGFENLSVAVNGTQIALTRDSALHKDGKVYLEDLDLEVKTGNAGRYRCTGDCRQIAAWRGRAEPLYGALRGGQQRCVHLPERDGDGGGRPRAP
jgi:CRISPR-associated protein Cmr4